MPAGPATERIPRALALKRRLVEDLSEMVLAERWVGLVDVSGIPATNMSQMRKGLRGKVKIRVAKKSVLARVITKCAAQRKGLDALLGQMKGCPALVLSREDPFRVQMMMRRMRTSRPAKGGEIAPRDIYVHEGATTFKPGPIVTELQRAGIPAAIEQGKVLIKKDKLLVGKGMPIPRDVALVLNKMGVRPLDVGLTLLSVWDDGVIYDARSLEIDEEGVLNDMRSAYAHALSLGLGVSWVSGETLPILLRKGWGDALALALGTGYVSEETVAPLLIRARGEALALACHVPGTDAGGDTAGEDRPPEKDEKGDPGKSPDDAASGLSSLFG